MATGGPCWFSYKTAVLFFPVLKFWPPAWLSLGASYPPLSLLLSLFPSLDSQTHSSLPSPKKMQCDQWGVSQNQSFRPPAALRLLWDVPGPGTHTQDRFSGHSR